MKTYRIHLIRHGVTKDNIEGVYCGITDTPLCEDGKEQLHQMKEEYNYPGGQFLFTSPLIRCKETAEILYPDLKPIVIDGLTEYNFGEFEGKTAEELQKKQQELEKEHMLMKKDVENLMTETGGIKEDIKEMKATLNQMAISLTKIAAKYEYENDKE